MSGGLFGTHLALKPKVPSVFSFCIGRILDAPFQGVGTSGGYGVPVSLRSLCSACMV
jgi:hypothetical protein